MSQEATECADVAVEETQEERGKHLYQRISELEGAPEGEVTKVLNKWQSQGRPLKTKDLINHVQDLRKYRRYNHALEVMEWLLNINGMDISYTNHAMHLDLTVKVRGIESVEDYFRNLPESAKNQRSYAALFNCYCSEKMADKVSELYQKMNELKLTSNALIHNNMMAMYLKLKQPERVITVLEEMKSHNVAPNNMTYGILINSYASMKDITSAEKMVQEMEEAEGVVPDWFVYGTLAAMYNSARLFEKTNPTLKKLEKLIDGRGREPFHLLMSLYAGAGNLEEVHRVWKLLKSTFSGKQTNMSYLTMLQALVKVNDIDGLKKCYEEWELVSESYDVTLTNVVVKALLRNNLVEEAETIVNNAKEKGAVINTGICDMFMYNYLKNEEIDAALHWLENTVQVAKGSKWKLGDQKINVFMEYYKNAKDVDGAENICKLLKALDCLNSSAYESLLRTYVASGRTESSLRKRVVEDKIQVSPTIEKLLDIVCGSV